MELSRITDLDLLKQGLKEAQEGIVNGEVDALVVYSVTAKAEKELKKANDIIKGYAKDEAVKFGEKTFSAHGSTFELRNGSGRAQYEDDEVYAELKKKMKAREELLKAALKSNETIYDSEGVEVPKVSVKYTADSLIVK